MQACPGPIAGLSQAVTALPWLELVAVVLALAYLALAVLQKRSCFVAAFVSTAIYVVLAYDAALSMHSALNVFYMGMALYGWWSWGSDVAPRPVSIWPLPVHAAAAAAIVAGSWLAARWFSINDDATLSWLDAATTLAAMWATLLLARKEWTNWLYWLVIDLALVYVFARSCLWLTAMLYLAYIALIPFGMVAWWRSRTAQR